MNNESTDLHAGSTFRAPLPVFLPTIVIGTQNWMRENLDVLTYRNGDIIPQVTDAAEWASLTTGAWCFYNNSPMDAVGYGKLYNWYAVNDPRGLAPQGWHIPSIAEWKILSDTLGGDAVAGGKVKTPGALYVDSGGIWGPPNVGATNESGFTALPSGYRLQNGAFANRGTHTFWWGAEETQLGFGSGRSVRFAATELKIGSPYKNWGSPVRCIRD